MNLNASISKCLIKRKLVTALFITMSVGAFATLGDGKQKGGGGTQSKALLSRPSHYNYKTFSLKSGYNYRGSMLFQTAKEEKFIMLNTVITYQKGNATYILPMKKKVLMDKIKFNPSGR